MERTYINQVQNSIGSTVKVQGFIENLRNSKAMAFIVLKDITGKLQITVEKADHPDLVDTIDTLTADSVITVTGKVVANDYVKMGGIEMIPTEIQVESIADALPIARKAIAATKKKKAVERSSIDQRIDYRWVDLRTDENQLMFKAQSCMVNAMRRYLLEQNFIEIHTPKLIAAASESGSEVFKVDYFDGNAYLAQSPQFYKQMAMAAGFERIFETGPVFRAEKSFTSKHATEFSGFDLEFSYITSYRDVMKMEEELLKAGLAAVKEAYGDQIQELFGQEVIVPETPFPVVTLAELYQGLEEDFGYVVDEAEKGDLTTEAERLSYDWVKKHYNHEFLFVTDYSAEKRAFYHMRDENGVPQGYDLIWRGVEITTGAQREHRYEVLKRQAEEKGLAEDVKFYLEFFQYGCPPHGGFGLGIDRLTMLLVGLPIKEAEFLFRGPNRLTP
ncbi:MAG: aspartate--tRNA(Asn) ligase [Faecalibacterium prausnitzii]|nr:aspartate--tRNA(Asn) ligase [Faecalibacterium prausnitzii]